MLMAAIHITIYTESNFLIIFVNEETTNRRKDVRATLIINNVELVNAVKSNIKYLWECHPNN